MEINALTGLLAVAGISDGWNLFVKLCGTMTTLQKVSSQSSFRMSVSWPLIVSIITKECCSFGIHFSSLTFKGKGTYTIPQPSVYQLVYVFPIFFRFHKYLNNFRLSKTLLTNRFFHWNMCFSIFLLPWRKRGVGEKENERSHLCYENNIM